jgi:hypothetical protein
MHPMSESTCTQTTVEHTQSVDDHVETMATLAKGSSRTPKR